jgi:hypothetical protein
MQLPGQIYNINIQGNYECKPQGVAEIFIGNIQGSEGQYAVDYLYRSAGALVAGYGEQLHHGRLYSCAAGGSHCHLPDPGHRRGQDDYLRMTPSGNSARRGISCLGLQKTGPWRANNLKIGPKKKNRITAAFD